MGGLCRRRRRSVLVALRGEMGVREADAEAAAQGEPAIVADVQGDGEADDEQQKFQQEFGEAGAVTGESRLRELGETGSRDGEEDAEAEAIEAPEGKGREEAEGNEHQDFGAGVRVVHQRGEVGAREELCEEEKDGEDEPGEAKGPGEHPEGGHALFRRLGRINISIHV